MSQNSIFQITKTALLTTTIAFGLGFGTVATSNASTSKITTETTAASVANDTGSGYIQLADGHAKDKKKGSYNSEKKDKKDKEKKSSYNSEKKKDKNKDKNKEPRGSF